MIMQITVENKSINSKYCNSELLGAYTMLTRQQKKRKERRLYKAVVWIAQITFVILCLTAMVSVTVIGLIG